MTLKDYVKVGKLVLHGDSNDKELDHHLFISDYNLPFYYYFFFFLWKILIITQSDRVRVQDL